MLSFVEDGDDDEPKLKNPRTLQSVYEVTGMTECGDGTVCENNSKCLAHPIREGKFICDCSSANKQAVQYAGVYCEHPATSYCVRDTKKNSRAFCTNSGECKVYVSKKEKHAGCKCPAGYAGEYCQFVEGSVPSDWTLENYMHPSLISAYDDTEGMSMSRAVSIVAGSVLGFTIIFGLLCAFFFCGRLGLTPVGFKRKDRDGNATFIGSAGAGGSSDFVGGKSVYKKKTSTSTGNFVTADNLDADGGLLTEIVKGEGAAGGEEDTNLETNVSMEAMEEVNLDELPSSLDVAAGEMA